MIELKRFSKRYHYYLVGFLAQSLYLISLTTIKIIVLLQQQQP